MHLSRLRSVGISINPDKCEASTMTSRPHWHVTSRDRTPRPIRSRRGNKSEGNDGGVLVHPRQKRAQPCAKRRLVLGKCRENSPGTVDQQLAKIAIASLGNPDQTRLAPCRDLPRYEAEPGGKISSARERLAFADRRGESRRVQHADARDRRQTSGCLIGFCARRKLVIEGSDALIETSPFLPYALEWLRALLA